MTAQGRELAAGRPLIDDLDRELLVAIARAPSRLMALARATGSCRLTARRRIDRLAERGLIEAQGGCFHPTDQGRGLLGDRCPTPWLDAARIKAATARDVIARAHGWRHDEVEEAPESANAASRPRVDKWTRLALAG